MSGDAGRPPAGDRGDPLLAAKLSVPRIRTPVVLRPRLLDAVAHGVDGPLTVVSGAPGAGKTLLLASWLAGGAVPGPAAWLTLDASDDQPGIFWAYVLESLRRAGVELPEDVGRPFLASGVAHLLLARLADALARGAQPVVLVLDQADNIRDAEIWKDLDVVIRNASPMLRLIVATRNEGALPLHRYELRGELVRISGADLAFTREEASELLRQHDLRLSPEVLAEVTDSTHGWAAGLRLSAVALQRRGDPEAFAAALPDSATALTTYLVDEVLDVQTADIRDFLLRTSVVDQVCPELADALTGRCDSDRVLAGLQVGNVLTEQLEQAPGCYRYHPLFAHVLRRELRRTHPGLEAELHRRAASWFDEHDRLVEAVQQAATARDWALAAGVVVRSLGVGAMLAGPEAGQLGSALAAVPFEEPGSMPAVVRAAVALSRFRLDDCRTEVVVAEKLAADEAGDHRAPVLASTAVLRAILARIDGDLGAAESALADGEAQLTAMPDRAARRPELTALLLSSVGTVQLWSGHFSDAEATLLRGLRVARAPGCEYPRLNILGRLAMVEFFRGRLQRTVRLAEEEIGFAETSGLPVADRTGVGHLALALVAAERGDRAGTRRHLSDAAHSVGAQHDPLVATFVHLLRAGQRAGAGDLAGAEAALSDAAAGRRTLPSWLAARVAETAVRLQLRRGDLAAAAAEVQQMDDRPGALICRALLAAAAGARRRALDLLRQVLESAPDVATDAERIEALLLAGRVHRDEHDQRAARQALERALALARPERRRRPFLAGDGQVLVRAFPAVVTTHSWLGAPAGGGNARPEGATAPGLAQGAPVQRLTERELTVLGHMARALSVEDIAQELYVSVNTVKTHQRGIYRKLGVGRRNEAVRRARDLGLV